MHFAHLSRDQKTIQLLMTAILGRRVLKTQKLLGSETLAVTFIILTSCPFNNGIIPIYSNRWGIIVSLNGQVADLSLNLIFIFNDAQHCSHRNKSWMFSV